MNHPTYTFEVVTNLAEICTSPLLDPLDQVIVQLQNKTIWINTIAKPLKPGDQFTVSGQQAIYLKKNYIDINYPLLKIVSEAIAIPTVTTDSAEFSFSLNANLVGTIVSGESITSYGFVWAEHALPTLLDNVSEVGTSDHSGEFTDTINDLPFPATIYVRAYATNSSGTGYGEVLSGESDICLAAGTSIRTKYGHKNIEDIDYDDDLMVWNFDEGQFDYSKPIWMVRPFVSNWKSVITFSNGKQLVTVHDNKGHRIYNANYGKFTHMMSDDTPIGTTTFDENGGLIEVAKKEVIQEKTTYYNVITDKHFNVFANGILTSTGLNNLYPIKDMKFIKTELQSNTNTFNVPDSIFNGLRLREHANYPNLSRKIKFMLSKQMPMANTINV